MNPGETRTIAPGVEHTFKAVPDTEARVYFRFSPPLGFESFLRDTEELIRSGKMVPYQSLNGLIYSSMLVRKYKDTLRASQKSVRMIMNLAVFAGTLMGKKV